MGPDVAISVRSRAASIAIRHGPTWSAAVHPARWAGRTGRGPPVRTVPAAGRGAAWTTDRDRAPRKYGPQPRTANQGSPAVCARRARQRAEAGNWWADAGRATTSRTAMSRVAARVERRATVGRGWSRTTPGAPAGRSTAGRGTGRRAARTRARVRATPEALPAVGRPWVRRRAKADTDHHAAATPATPPADHPPARAGTAHRLAGTEHHAVGTRGRATRAAPADHSPAPAGMARRAARIPTKGKATPGVPVAGSPWEAPLPVGTDRLAARIRAIPGVPAASRQQVRRRAKADTDHHAAATPATPPADHPPARADTAHRANRSRVAAKTRGRSRADTAPRPRTRSRSRPATASRAAGAANRSRPGRSARRSPGTARPCRSW
jgi:hypothetical protein